MRALLNPLDRTWRSIRWGLVIHTAAMFSFATIYIGTGLDMQPICYIDNREYRGNRPPTPGPVGCQILLYPTGIAIVPNTLFLVNSWLADGLLVSPVSVLVAKLSDLGRAFSSIVALLYMRGTTGSSPSRA